MLGQTSHRMRGPKWTITYACHFEPKYYIIFSRLEILVYIYNKEVLFQFGMQFLRQLYWIYLLFFFHYMFFCPLYPNKADNIHLGEIHFVVLREHLVQLKREKNFISVLSSPFFFSVIYIFLSFFFLCFVLISYYSFFDVLLFRYNQSTNI